jgi:branched-chain amino acid transport system ATP-binding protein
MSALLEVDRINSYYEDSHILFDVSLRVEKNEVVALLGRNGAGKSTTLKSLIGSVRPRSGSIVFDGTRTQGLAPHAIACLGLQLVPEERRIFGSLSVEENLVLAGLTATPRWPLERVWTMFPRLQERRRSRGTDLSGGEQQMLAIARALMSRPRLLLLDEPSLGLSPILVQTIFAVIREINARGTTVLLVEQNARQALAIASRGYVLEVGTIVYEDTAANLMASEAVRSAYLGG